MKYSYSDLFQAREAEITKMMKAESERAKEADALKAKEEYAERVGGVIFSCGICNGPVSQVLYQQQLEKQLEEQEINKQRQYEEFLKEKLMIDEIVRKIYEEDMR